MELVWSAGDDDEPEEGPPEKRGPGVVEIEYDPETGFPLPEKRPTNLENTWLVTFTLILIEAMLGAGFREIAIEIAIDKGWARVCFLFLTPVQVFFTLVCPTVMCLTFADKPVLRPGHCRLYCPVHRPDSTSHFELPILLRSAAPPYHRRAR